MLPCWPAPLVPPQCTHGCWSGYKRGQCRAPGETLFPSVAIGCGIPTPGTYPTGARTPTLPQGWQRATGCRGAAVVQPAASQHTLHGQRLFFL